MTASIAELPGSASHGHGPGGERLEDLLRSVDMNGVGHPAVEHPREGVVEDGVGSLEPDGSAVP